MPRMHRQDGRAKPRAAGYSGNALPLFLGLPRQHGLGHAVGVDRGREAAIDRDLPQHGGQFLGSEAVAQRAAEMRLEFVHAAEETAGQPAR